MIKILKSVWNDDNENLFYKVIHTEPKNLPEVQILHTVGKSFCYAVKDNDGDIVRIIGEQAFKDDTDVMSLSFGELYKIEKEAFCNCINLRKVEIGLEPIDKGVVRLPYFISEKVDNKEEKEASLKISSFAFKDCRNLDTIIIHLKNLKKIIIESNAFSGCNKLRTVYIWCEKSDEVCDERIQIDSLAFAGKLNFKLYSNYDKLKTVAKKCNIEFEKADYSGIASEK